MRAASIKSTSSSLIRQLNYIPYRQRNAHLSPKMSVSSKASFYTFKPSKKLVPLKKSETPQKVYFDLGDNDYVGEQVSSPIHELDVLVGFQKVEMEEMISDELNCIVEQPESERKIEENESSTTEHFEDNKYLGVDDWRECSDVRDEHNQQAHLEDKQSREPAAAQNSKYHTSKKQSNENKSSHNFTQTKVGKLEKKGEAQIVNLKLEVHNQQQKKVAGQEVNDSKFNQTLKKLRQNRRDKRGSIKIMGKQKQTKAIDNTTSNKLLKRFKSKNL